MPRLKISRDTLTDFFNSRNAREKLFFIVFGVCLLLTLDALLFIQPIIRTLSSTRPELNHLKENLMRLKEDQKNKAQIEKEWQDAKNKLTESESQFVASNEGSVLFQKLSQLAVETGVKIISQSPVTNETEKADAYTRQQIKMTALAGAHELGNFLAKVESSPTFFRVTNLNIAENSSDIKRHSLEIEIESYRKG